MINALSIKISLWMATLFLSSFSDWKCWVHYIRVLDVAENENEILRARKWVGRKCPFRVETACFLVYLGVREPLSFIASLVVLLGGSFYLTYFVITELLARYSIGG